MSDRETVKVAFIAGSGRCGSTLLDLLLGHLDGFFSVGEFNSLLHNHDITIRDLCTCGVPFNECSFWTRVMNKVYGGIGTFDKTQFMQYAKQTGRNHHFVQLIAGTPTSRLRRSLDEYTAELYKLYSTIKREAGCEVVIDSSKYPNYGIALQMTKGIELHVIHVVRDARAVAWSHMRKKRMLDTPERKLYLHRHKPWKSALKWGKSNLQSWLLGKATRRHTLLRYEDLVHDPKAALQSIVASLGMPHQQFSFLDGHSFKQKTSHNVAGNPMRFLGKDIQIKMDTEWTQRLSWIDRNTINLLAAPHLARYGYFSSNCSRS